MLLNLDERLLDHHHDVADSFVGRRSSDAVALSCSISAAVSRASAAAAAAVLVVARRVVVLVDMF